MKERLTTTQLRQFAVSVQSDSNKETVWLVRATTEDDALQLAFALDGGWSAQKNASEMLELAKAHCTISDVPINPKLPKNFSCTANEARPASHQKWWNKPYIQTVGADEQQSAGWLEAWPSGIRYDVRCLDGGAWDRPTCWGMFATLEEAIVCAKAGPKWRAS